MKNFVQAGDTVTVPAPADVASGDFVVVGSLRGAAVADAESGADVEVKRSGVFTMPKVTGAAWIVGDDLYWDASAKKFTKTATDNTLAGVAAAVAENAATTGNVLLIQ